MYVVLYPKVDSVISYIQTDIILDIKRKYENGCNLLHSKVIYFLQNDTYEKEVYKGQTSSRPLKVY